MSKKPSIIVASAHVMNGPLKLGSSHLARCFAAKGYRTLYLNAPTSPLHWLNARSRPAARQRLSALRLQQSEAPNLSVLTPFTLLPHYNAPLLRSAFTLENWFRLTLPRIELGISEAGFADAGAILFDTVIFWPLIRRLGRPSIYRIADRIDGFAVNSAAMIAMHRQAMRDANLVIYTARGLAPDASERARLSRLVSNGVQYDLFQAPQPRPAEYRGLAGPIAVYVGAIASWFDVAGLRETARRFPNVSFVIIGPHTATTSMPGVGELANVHVLGPRPHARIPAYLQHANIAFIPFDLAREGEMLDSVCPLKLFEYLACGLDVVCFGGREVEQLEAPAVLYDPRSGAETTHRTLADAFAAVLAKPVAAPEVIATRRAFAHSADWTARVAELEAAMHESGLM